mmetsp:Transcript_63045/g.165280  ORF Transcript_63045/g.165280 Transcript_63045/m.165280 type:complete len:228 (+) Transcript_63045:98-781(+)
MGLHYCQLCEHSGPELYRGSNAIVGDTCSTSCECYDCLCEACAVEAEIECDDCGAQMGCKKCWKDPCAAVMRCPCKDCPVEKLRTEKVYRCEECLATELNECGVDKGGAHVTAKRDSCGHTVCEMFDEDECPYCEAEQENQERQQKAKEASTRLAKDSKQDLQNLHAIVPDKLATKAVSETMSNLIAGLRGNIDRHESKYGKLCENEENAENADPNGAPPTKRIRTE